MSWAPTLVNRFIEGYPSSCHTALVETDEGLGYMKAMGSREGPHTLAAEVVAVQLASWLGLPTFDWAVINVDPVVEIPFIEREGNQFGAAECGPAFITRAEIGDTWKGTKAELNRLCNPEDITRLVVLDTWLLNCDRHAILGSGPSRRIRRNLHNVFLSADAAPRGHFQLKAMDHTHCFTCGKPWTSKLRHIDQVKDRRLFGKFPEFADYLDKELVDESAKRLRDLQSEEVRTMVTFIPPEWDVDAEAASALVDLVVGRAAFVADTIHDLLWPQQFIDYAASGEPEA